jgi:hypothetical protein
MKLCCAILTVLLLLGIGCAPTHSVPIAPVRDMSVEERNFEAMFLASETVLRDCGFELDRRDRRRGEITTRPMLARQAMEFWRDDSGSFYEMVENSLQKIFLVAQVEITRPDPESSNFYASVKVYRMRSSSREQSFEPIIYGKGGLTWQTPSQPGVRDSRANYVDMGEDPGFARKLEAEIAHNAMTQQGRLLQHPDIGH